MQFKKKKKKIEYYIFYIKNIDLGRGSMLIIQLQFKFIFDFGLIDYMREDLGNLV